MNNSDQAKQSVEKPFEDKDFGESQLELVRAKNISTQYLNPTVWGQIVGMAKTFISSGALPQHYKNASMVAMGLQAGFEMGMKPVESLNSLYPVNGTFNIWGKAVVKRLRVHGFKVKYKDETENSCTAVVTKIDDDNEVYEETMTFELAQKSGYTHATNKANQKYLKVGWKEGMNRKRKLRYGALSMIIHTYIPDVLDSASEIQEVYEDAVPQIIEEKAQEGEVVSTVQSENVQTIDEVEDLNAFLKERKEEKKQAEKSAKNQDKEVVDNVGKKEHTKSSKKKTEEKK